MKWFEKLFRRRRVYLDYAASTPIDKSVLKEMLPFFSLYFGNPGALYEEGRTAKRTLSIWRERIARALGGAPEEVIFTSGGTESNNLAIYGHLRALEREGAPGRIHVVTSSAEHPSVLDCFRSLEKEGFLVSYIDFNEEGLISPDSIRRALTPDTRFVSIAYVNSEIGTVQSLSEITKVIRAHEGAHKKRIVFHTDGSQAPLYFDVTPRLTGVDLLTVDGQKLYGPKGVGFLYKKKGVPLLSVMKGGKQEFGFRPGTENIPLIVGMGVSFIHAVRERDQATRSMKVLQEYFISSILKRIPRSVLNGSQVKRSPANINISIPGVDNEYLVIALDKRGISAATRSACLGYDTGDASYVVGSLKKSEEEAKSTLRFSLGRHTTRKDVDYVLAALVEEVEKLDKLTF